MNKLRSWMRRIAFVYYPLTRKFFSGLMIQKLQQILTLKKYIISFIELKRNLNSSVQGYLNPGLSLATTTRWGCIQRCESHVSSLVARLWHNHSLPFNRLEPLVCALLAWIAVPLRLPIKAQMLEHQSRKNMILQSECGCAWQARDRCHAQPHSLLLSSL